MHGDLCSERIDRWVAYFAAEQRVSRDYVRTEGWSESLAFELAKFGIRMKTVAPGLAVEAKAFRKQVEAMFMG